VSARGTPVVERRYHASPDACTRAVEVLLNRSATKKAAEPAPEPDGRDDAAVVGHREEVTHVKQLPN